MASVRTALRDARGDRGSGALRDRHALSVWSGAPRRGVAAYAPRSGRAGRRRSRLHDRSGSSTRMGSWRADSDRRRDSVGALGKARSPGLGWSPAAA
jgi:hypothetical protein